MEHNKESQKLNTTRKEQTKKQNKNKKNKTVTGLNEM